MTTTALRREVESLLTSDTSDVSFLDRLPVVSEPGLADPLAALSASMDHTRSRPVLSAGLRVGPSSNTLTAVPVETSGSTFSAGEPAKVFDAQVR